MGIILNTNGVKFKEVITTSGLHTSISTIFYYSILDIGLEWAFINKIQVLSLKMGVFF